MLCTYVTLTKLVTGRADRASNRKDKKGQKSAKNNKKYHLLPLTLVDTLATSVLTVANIMLSPPPAASPPPPPRSLAAISAAALPAASAAAAADECLAPAPSWCPCTSSFWRRWCSGDHDDGDDDDICGGGVCMANLAAAASSPPAPAAGVPLSTISHPSAAEEAFPSAAAFWGCFGPDKPRRTNTHTHTHTNTHTRKRNIGDRVSAEELFGSAFLLPCNDPESMALQ